MSAIHRPIHIAAVGLANLRFFAPPSGGREFPWLSIDDLHACLCLSRALRREFKTRLRSSQWRDDSRAVATPDGIVNVVPHYMAQGLINALRDMGRCQPDFYALYTREGAKALGKLTEGMPPDDMMSYVRDAWAASGGNAG